MGAVLRYLSSEFVRKLFTTPFPAGTFAVNAAGSFLIGILFASFETRILPEELRLFATTGFLGGYTTFSSYSLEAARLLLNGDTKLFIANILVSNVICIVFALAGIRLAS